MCATTTRTDPTSYTLLPETMNKIEVVVVVVVCGYSLLFSILADLRVELVLPLAKSFQG